MAIVEFLSSIKDRIAMISTWNHRKHYDSIIQFLESSDTSHVLSLRPESVRGWIEKTGFSAEVHERRGEDGCSRKSEDAPNRKSLSVPNWVIQKTKHNKTSIGF